MSLSNDGSPMPVEKQKPFSREEKRAAGVSMVCNEIGLLDVVIMDAFASGDVLYQWVSNAWVLSNNDRRAVIR